MKDSFFDCAFRVAAMLLAAWASFCAAGCRCGSPVESPGLSPAGIAPATARAPSEAITTTPADESQSRVGVVVDIDETISVTDYAGFFGLRENGSRPYENARDVLCRLNGDFDIIYLTARPQWLFSETRKWLREAGFPKGPVVTTGRVVDVFWPGAFKTRSLAMLRLRQPQILIGIGDRETDVAAYSANGMLSLVVHAPNGSNYANAAVVLADWVEVGRFFEQHHHVLKDPQRLMDEFGVGGEQLAPESVFTRADVDLSLLYELPLMAPALLLEPLIKVEAIHEQIEARRALRSAQISFEQALREAADNYGDENLLDMQLGMKSGKPVYQVRFLHEGRVSEVLIDGLTGAMSPVRKPLSSMPDAREARPLAQITFRRALELALQELAGAPYELELEMDDNQPTYELAVEAQGQFVEIELHAATGEILEVENETALR